MGRRKRILLKVGIVAAVLLLVGGLSAYYLTRGYWEDFQFTRITYTPDQIPPPDAIEMHGFHVRPYLETKICMDMKVNQGKYYISVYWVPEDDDQYILGNGTEEEITELYLAGVRPEITDTMELVYEACYDASGIYEIDTAGWKNGYYTMVMHGSNDADLSVAYRYRYRHYNWMDFERKIRCGILGGENDNRYCPY